MTEKSVHVDRSWTGKRNLDNIRSVPGILHRGGLQERLTSGTPKRFTRSNSGLSPGLTTGEKDSEYCMR